MAIMASSIVLSYYIAIPLKDHAEYWMTYLAFPNGSVLWPRCKEGNEKYPYNFASQRIKE
jgi:hypothetical protein